VSPFLSIFPLGRFNNMSLRFFFLEIELQELVHYEFLCEMLQHYLL
jgi:hypothetical protein